MECEALRAIDDSGIEQQAATQSRAVQELIVAGTYEMIEMMPTGLVKARTGTIIIDWEGVDVPMGQYEISIDEQESVRIRSRENWDATSYPHPHVSTDHEPCLGDVRASIGKLVGAMQMAEALQVLHSFLCSYNADSAYEKLSTYAPHLVSEGDDDEESDPCEDCDERLTPYCICECPSNEGAWSCSDCCDYRETYCFLECSLNSGWTVCDPCEDCEHDECVEDECPYYTKKKEVRN